MKEHKITVCITRGPVQVIDQIDFNVPDTDKLYDICVDCNESFPCVTCAIYILQTGEYHEE
jgi:hypothetical protein